MRSRLTPRGTHGSALTSDPPSPIASCCSHGPVFGPNADASVDSSTAASSATVRNPMSASFRAVFDPMPHSASVG